MNFVNKSDTVKEENGFTASRYFRLYGGAHPATLYIIVNSVDPGQTASNSPSDPKPHRSLLFSMATENLVTTEVDLYAAVATNSWETLEAWFRGPKLANLSGEEYKKLIRYCVKYPQPKSLHVILTNAPDLKDAFLEQEAELVKTDAALSVLGETCLDYYDIGTLEVLTDAGCKYISQKELRLFITRTLFIRRNNENICGYRDHCCPSPDNASERVHAKTTGCIECTDDSTERFHTQETECDECSFLYSIQIQHFLAFFSNVHADVLKLVDDLPMKDMRPSECWWEYYIRYGWKFCDPAFQALMHLSGHSTILDTLHGVEKQDILSTLTVDQLNTHFKVYFPESEAGSDWTLLSYAVSLGEIDAVKLLINLGAGVNEFCGENLNGNVIFFTPLELAVEMNHTDICRILIENGSNLNMSSSGYYGDILKNSIVNGNLKILALILASKRYPRHELTFHSDNLTLMQEESTLCKDMKSSTLCKVKEMKSYILHCLRYGILSKTTLAFDAMYRLDWPVFNEIVVTMSKSELNVEVVRVGDGEQAGESDTLTLLVYAVMKGHNRLVRWLVSKGVDINHICDISTHPHQARYTTAVCQAIETRNLDISQFLITKGAMCFLTGPNGRLSVWISAFLSRDPKMVQFLMNLTRFFTPTHVFAEFIIYCVDENTSAWFPITKIFTIDVLKVVFYREFDLRKGVWKRLLNKILLSPVTQKYYISILGHLMNYLPAWTVSFREAVIETLSICANGSAGFVSGLYVQSKTVRSLKHLCRYAVRQSCTPFTREEVSSLGIPAHLKDYLLDQSGMVLKID